MDTLEGSGSSRQGVYDNSYPCERGGSCYIDKFEAVANLLTGPSKGSPDGHKSEHPVSSLTSRLTSPHDQKRHRRMPLQGLGRSGQC